MKKLTAWALAGFWGSLAHLSPCNPESIKPPPNIILIMADDLGYGDLGCFGSERFATPNLDAMAAGGVRFIDFHSNGPICSPTRAAFMTGRYQQRTGITGVVTAKGHRHTGLDLDEVTFAEIAQQAGYATALFGKWHLGYQPAFNPIHQGFDEFIGFVAGNIDYHAHLDETGAEDWWKQDELTPEEGYTTDLITEHGLDFIQRNRDRPFLLYLAHEAPHYPFQGRNDPPRYTREDGRTEDPVTLPVYREMIEVMDEGIGRIRDAIKDAGLAEQTLIFFTSDNGHSALGSAGPLRGKKGTLYEGGHRVPTVAYWPGRIEAGWVSAEPAMTMDLLPTVAALAAVTVPPEVILDGIDLSAHLLDGEPLPDRPLFWQYRKSMAMRLGDYKLIMNPSSETPELYHLGRDLGEQHDLADAEPARVEQMLTQLNAWYAEVTQGVPVRTQ